MNKLQRMGNFRSTCGRLRPRSDLIERRAEAWSALTSRREHRLRPQTRRLPDRPRLCITFRLCSASPYFFW